MLSTSGGGEPPPEPNDGLRRSKRNKFHLDVAALHLMNPERARKGRTTNSCTPSPALPADGGASTVPLPSPPFPSPSPSIVPSASSSTTTTPLIVPVAAPPNKRGRKRKVVPQPEAAVPAEVVVTAQPPTPPPVAEAQPAAEPKEEIPTVPKEPTPAPAVESNHEETAIKEEAQEEEGGDEKEIGEEDDEGLIIGTSGGAMDGSVSPSPSLNSSRLDPKKLPYKCDKCPATFDSRPALFSHSKRHGAGDRNKCPYCDYSSNSLPAIRTHRHLHIREGHIPLAEQVAAEEPTPPPAKLPRLSTAHLPASVVDVLEDLDRDRSGSEEEEAKKAVAPIEEGTTEEILSETNEPLPPVLTREVPPAEEEEDEGDDEPPVIDGQSSSLAPLSVDIDPFATTDTEPDNDFLEDDDEEELRRKREAEDDDESSTSPTKKRKSRRRAIKKQDPNCVYYDSPPSHSRYATSGGKYQCEKCPFTTRDNERLERHIGGHNRPSGFQCPMCDFRSDSAGFLRRHVEIHKVKDYPWPPVYYGLPLTTSQSGEPQINGEDESAEVKEERSIPVGKILKAQHQALTSAAVRATAPNAALITGEGSATNASTAAAAIAYPVLAKHAASRAAKMRAEDTEAAAAASSSMPSTPIKSEQAPDATEVAPIPTDSTASVDAVVEPLEKEDKMKAIAVPAKDREEVPRPPKKIPEGARKCPAKNCRFVSFLPSSLVTHRRKCHGFRKKQNVGTCGQCGIFVGKHRGQAILHSHRALHRIAQKSRFKRSTTEFFLAEVMGVRKLPESMVMSKKKAAAAMVEIKQEPLDDENPPLLKMEEDLKKEEPEFETPVSRAVSIHHDRSMSNMSCPPGDASAQIDGKYKCQRCPYIVQRYSSLQRHLQNHEALGDYSCAHCTFSCNNEVLYETHVADHAAEAARCSASGTPTPIYAKRTSAADEDSKEEETESPPPLFEAEHPANGPTYTSPTPSEDDDDDGAPPKLEVQDGDQEDSNSAPVLEEAAPPSLLDVTFVSTGGEGGANGGVEEESPISNANSCSPSKRGSSGRGGNRNGRGRGGRGSRGGAAIIGFRVELDAKAAKKVMTPEGPRFLCDMCPYLTKHIGDLRAHLKMHKGSRPEKCPSCSYSTLRPSSLEAHLELHSRFARGGMYWEAKMEDGRKRKANKDSEASLESSPKEEAAARPPPAVECPVRIRHYGLIGARIEETESRTYACAHCPQRAPTASGLWQHARRHIDAFSSTMTSGGSSPLRCTHCSFSSIRIKAAVKHNLGVCSGAAINNALKCAGCDFKAYVQVAMTEHCSSTGHTQAVVTPAALGKKEGDEEEEDPCSNSSSSSSSGQATPVFSPKMTRNKLAAKAAATAAAAAAAVSVSLPRTTPSAPKPRTPPRTMQFGGVAIDVVAAHRLVRPTKAEKTFLKMAAEADSLAMIHCPECPFADPDDIVFRLHRDMHTEPKRAYECTLCTYSSSTPEALHRHISLHIPEDKKRQSVGHANGRKPAHRRHSHEHIPAGVEALECGVCSFRTLDPARFWNHRLEHAQHIQQRLTTQIKRNAAAIAEATTNDTRNGITKKKVKSKPGASSRELRQLPCAKCSFRCETGAALTRHQELHGSDGIFKCAACDYASNTKQVLDFHTHFHHCDIPVEYLVKKAQLAPELCPTKIASSLADRVRLAGQIFTCHECQKEFIESRALLSHLENDHNLRGSDVACHLELGMLPTNRILTKA